jgi:transposase
MVRHYLFRAFSLPAAERATMQSIAGIDVHKKLLTAVIADAASPETIRAQDKFGTGHAELERLRQWLQAAQVTHVIMESTAQYWRPVWNHLESGFTLHLAHAQSNRAPRGRKSDWADAKRLVKRFAAGELFLSFVPDPSQRDWRMITRARQALVRDHVQIQNRVEALLEQASLKLSSVMSDLFSVSGLRILQALAEGETNPEQLAQLADPRLRCGREALLDALRGSFGSVHRRLLAQALQHWRAIQADIQELNLLAAQLMQPYAEVVARLIEVPGIGAEAAQEILAEIGPQAAAFPTGAQLASWIGVCPGTQESAGNNRSGRCPKGNPYIRRVLCQVAHAASRTKASHPQLLCKRFLPRLGYNKAVWAVAHRLTLIIWNILHRGVRYIEHGEAINPKAVQRSIQRHLKALRRLGYDIPSPLLLT